ncbi:MAG: hypothetical protein ACPG4Y_05570 [Chitinophagales bacterium]
MNKQKHINFKAILMLFIIAISSVGMPLITHSCSHSNQKDIHLFSSDHHCNDKCGASSETDEILSFSKAPCCSFEASFLKNVNLFSSNKQLSSKQIVMLYSLFLPKESLQVFYNEQIYSNTYYHKRFGYQYRIAIQSFLC